MLLEVMYPLSSYTERVQHLRRCWSVEAHAFAKRQARRSDACRLCCFFLHHNVAWRAAPLSMRIKHADVVMGEDAVVQAEELEVRSRVVHFRRITQLK